VWRSLTVPPDPAQLPLSHSARAAFDALEERGASFFGDLVNATGLLRTEVEKGLGELVAWGSSPRTASRACARCSCRPIGGAPSADSGGEGTWRRSESVRLGGGRACGPGAAAGGAVAEAVARQLLRRYGVVFRRVVTRETLLTPWRDILRVYRRLEARGEIRGGRFVGGFSGSSTRCRKRWGCCAACGARSRAASWWP